MKSIKSRRVKVCAIISVLLCLFGHQIYHWSNPAKESGVVQVSHQSTGTPMKMAGMSIANSISLQDPISRQQENVHYAVMGCACFVLFITSFGVLVLKKEK